MEVKKGSKVKVHYTGKLDDGSVFDSSLEREPLVFTAGEGQVIKGFDDAVQGMSVDEEKNITLPADQAYGQRNEQLVQELPKSMFVSNPELLVEGQHIVMKAPDGQQLPAVIKEIKDEKVIVDMNPPLAGQTLHFTLKVVGVE